MTAGRGIVHSEMPEQEDGLDVGLPALGQPAGEGQDDGAALSGNPPAEIPTASLPGGVTAKVIAGEVAGVRGPINGIATEPTMLDIALPAAGKVALADPGGSYGLSLPVPGRYRGRRAHAIGLGHGNLAVLGAGDAVRIAALGGEARVLLVADGR